jgi:hypothetical protein
MKVKILVTVLIVFFFSPLVWLQQIQGVNSWYFLTMPPYVFDTVETKSYMGYDLELADSCQYLSMGGDTKYGSGYNTLLGFWRKNVQFSTLDTFKLKIKSITRTSSLFAVNIHLELQDSNGSFYSSFGRVLIDSPDWQILSWDFTKINKLMKTFNLITISVEAVSVDSAHVVFVEAVDYLAGVDSLGITKIYDNFGGSVTGVRKLVEDPTDYTLFQNYPNPFNPNTTINYSLAKAGNINLMVYNAIGSKVATLVNEYKPAGNYSVQFKGIGLSSGIYFYRMESGNYSAAKKFILMK